MTQINSKDTTAQTEHEPASQLGGIGYDQWQITDNAVQKRTQA